MTTVRAEAIRVDNWLQMLENELVIEAWSPIHLRSKLQELYWKDARGTNKVRTRKSAETGVLAW